MENKYIIGTHNSMTYLPLKKWYMYPFNFIAKCQSKTIEQQYESGIRLFDLRINFDKKGNLRFKHGLITYKGRVSDVLNYLNTRKEKVYVRLLLEVNNGEDCVMQEVQFIRACKYFEKAYKNITFFCGRAKCSWRQVYVFKFEEPNIKQYVGSMNKNKLYAIWPWLYAKLYNKKNLREVKEGWILMDFI